MKKFALALLPFVVSTSVLAEENKKHGLTLEASTGMMSAHAVEKVYFTEQGDHLASKLDWKAENVPIVKLGTNLNVNDRWSVGGSFWTIIDGKDRASMTDRDWMEEIYDEDGELEDTIPSDEQTHFSSHPLSDLKKAYEIDINTTYWFANGANYNMGAMLGYKHSYMSFDARGGYAKYGDAPTKLYASDLVLGSYSQKWTAPYAGLDSRVQFGNSEIGVVLKYSPFARNVSIDEHHLMEFTTTDKSISRSDMYSAGVNYNYAFSKNAKMYVDYVVTKYDETRQETHMNYYGLGIEGTYDADEQQGGASSLSQQVTVGLKYSF